MWLGNYPIWCGITKENKTKAGMRMWHCDIKVPWHNPLISLFSPVLGSSPSQLNGIHWVHTNAPRSVSYWGTPNGTQCPYGASPVPGRKKHCLLTWLAVLSLAQPGAQLAFSARHGDVSCLSCPPQPPDSFLQSCLLSSQLHPTLMHGVIASQTQDSALLNLDKAQV